MRISIEGELGQGGHSSVKFARDVDTLKPVAAKVMDLDANGRRLFKQEAAMLSRLPAHKNLPKLIGVSRGNSDGKDIGYIVLEYLPFPSLREFLGSKMALPESEAFYILRQMIDVISMLVKYGVAHRDLKPENIMINPDNLTIKLIDFGLGHLIDGEDAVDTSYRGTPIYMSPDVLKQSSAYKVIKSELYSAAIITYELITGIQPFADYTSRQAIITAQLYGLDLSPLSEEAATIIRHFTSFFESDRPTLAFAAAVVDKYFPHPSRMSPMRLSWAASRSTSFENVRGYTATQAKARSGVLEGIAYKVLAKARDLADGADQMTAGAPALPLTSRI